MTQEVLFNTLEDLGDKEFKNFKWYLQQPDILGDYQSIKKSKLENADRQDTVDLMLSTFEPPGALTVTKKVLKKMNRNDLVQSLSDASSGPEGGKTAADSTSAAAPPAAAPATMMAQQGSVIFAPTVGGGPSGTWNITINK